MANKLYMYIDHSTRPTSRAFVCASSKAAAAEVIGLPLSRVSNYLTVATGDTAAQYSHLKPGQIEYVAAKEAPKGMSLLDLERIAALGYLKTAKMALHQCDLPADEKERLAKIVAQIDELRADVSDRLEARYKGR